MILIRSEPNWGNYNTIIGIKIIGTPKRANGLILCVFHRAGIRISFSSCVLLPRPFPRYTHEVYFQCRRYWTWLLLRATNKGSSDTHDSCLSLVLFASTALEYKRSFYSGPSSSLKTPSKQVPSPFLISFEIIIYMLSLMAASYSPAFHCSTISVSGLNFSVRDGKRCTPPQ